MGQVKPGDRISIKNPERNSLVKAGRLQLKAPDNITIEVPDYLDRRDLKVLDHLVEWGVLALNDEPEHKLQHVEYDVLDIELLTEYDDLNAEEAAEFILSLNKNRQAKFIEHERSHKNRKTVLRVFE